MKAYLIVFMINSFVIYELLVRLTRKIFRTQNRNQGKTFFLISLLILLAHFLLYSYNKERNYFQKMEINRIFGSSDLKRSYRQLQIKYHPDKIKEKTENDEKTYIELREIHDILSTAEKKDIYDKYGTKNEELANTNDQKEKDHTNLIFSIAEGTLIYTVYFIFAIILTYDDNVKSSRKWFVLMIFLGVLLELFFYFIKDITEADFLDSLFPQATIFERIEIIRFSIGPLGNLCRCAYRIFCKLPFDLILDQNDKIMAYQQDLTQMLNNKDQKNKDKIIDKLKQLETLSSEIYQNIETEITNREKENQIGWFKKMFKWGLVLLMFYGVFANFISSGHDKNEL